jgi:hypothetical protein
MKPWFLLLALLVSAAPAGADVHGVPLPARSRSLAEDLFESGQPFRKTVDFYKRFLNRAGLAHEAIPIYRHRGVVVARFITMDRAAAWRAIHIFQAEGRTRIVIVSAPLDEPRPAR